MCMRRGILFLALAACGGRIIVPAERTDPSSDAGVGEGESDAGYVDLSRGCALVLDVRMCTPMCVAFDCCETLYDDRGNPDGVGMCWIDQPNPRPCNASCAACVHKAPGEDVCVPDYLCIG